MLQIIKFPESKSFGGFNERYQAALEAHFAYAEAQRRRLHFEKSELAPAWTDTVNVIWVALKQKPDRETREAAINNLIGSAIHQGKNIIRAWQGMKDGEWLLIAEVVEPVSV